MGIAELKVLLRRRFSNTENMSKLVIFAFFLVLLVLVPSSDATAPEKCGPDHWGFLAPQDRSAKTRKCCAHLNMQKEKTTNAVRVIRALKEKGKLSTQRARKMVPEFFFQRLLSSFF